MKNLGIITRPARRVALCGGGRISYYLAQLLQKIKGFFEDNLLRLRKK
jgi:hypothetical protein